MLICLLTILLGSMWIFWPKRAWQWTVLTPCSVKCTKHLSGDSGCHSLCTGERWLCHCTQQWKWKCPWTSYEDEWMILRFIFVSKVRKMTLLYVVHGVKQSFSESTAMVLCRSWLCMFVPLSLTGCSYLSQAPCQCWTSWLTSAEAKWAVFGGVACPLYLHGDVWSCPPSPCFEAGNVGYW